MGEIKPEIVERFMRALGLSGAYAMGEPHGSRVELPEDTYDIRAALAAVAADIDRAGYERGVREAARAVTFPGMYEAHDRILALLERPASAPIVEGPGPALTSPEDPRIPALMAAVRWLLDGGDDPWAAGEHLDALARAEEAHRG